MTEHFLSFGKTIQIAPNLAEIIVGEGVEMDMAMVSEYHDWITEHLTSPCFLLINKANSYTYTFRAQLAMVNIEQVRAMAVVVHTESSRISTKNLFDIPRDKKWNAKMFNTREDALAWLKTQS